MIKKILSTILVTLLFSNYIFASDACLMSDNLSKIKCEREIYLEQNISDIANSNWVNEVLWWTFYTTKIERLEDQKAVVDFEDWHILIIAEVEFEEDNNITDFEVIYPQDYFDSKENDKEESKETNNEIKKENSTIKNFFLGIINFFKGIFK